MTTDYWPKDSADNAPLPDVEWARVTRRFAFSGIVGGVNGIGFAPSITPGVGLFCAAGELIHRGFRRWSDAPQQASIPQNAGGTDRKDLWTYRSDMAVSPEPVLTYVTGGTSFPTIQRNEDGVFDVPIAKVTVPSGSTVPSSFEDARLWVEAHVIPCRSVLDVPAAELRPGLIASGLWGMAMWNGSSWRHLLDEATGTISLGAGWSSWGGSYKAPSWRRDRSRVYLSGVVKRTGATVQVEPDNGSFRFTVELPTSYRPNGTRIMVAAAGSDLTGTARGRVIYKPGLGLHYQPGTVVTFPQNTGYIALDGISYDLD